MLLAWEGVEATNHKTFNCPIQGYCSELSSRRLDERATLIVSIALTLHGKKVLERLQNNAPTLVSNQVRDWVHDGMKVGVDLVDSCLVVLSSDEENLTLSVNSLDELDIVYTRRVP